MIQTITKDSVNRKQRKFSTQHSNSRQRQLTPKRSAVSENRKKFNKNNVALVCNRRSGGGNRTLKKKFKK